MERILHQFLQNPEMEKLCYEARNNNNEEARKQLNEKFNDYLFEVYFLSYVNKTISLTAKEIYRKNKILQNREACFLNSPEPESAIELIDSIPDNSGDFVEEIICKEESTTLANHLIDPHLIKAVSRLNDKQKLIIYKTFVEQKSPSGIARELDIPNKTVRNLKCQALKSLRQWLRSEKNNTDNK
ncbi:MAG: sigma-70 family RNA polymerase sigma factor [Bacillota bacterium]